MGNVQQAGGADDPAVQAVVKQVMAMIKDGSKIGLGSGRASTAFIQELGRAVKQGLKVVGVPTSEDSARLAKQLGIPLVELTEDLVLDLTVDGADEVSPELDLVKGWGGALVRERIVAEASLRQIILVGPEKMVDSLGARGRIPVEVIPLAEGYIKRKLKTIGLIPTVRLLKDDQTPFVTDNGNLTLDCALVSPIKGGKLIRELESKILLIAGVVDTGLFLGTCTQVLVGQADGTVTSLFPKQ